MGRGFAADPKPRSRRAGSDLPLVSLCTVTCNRQRFLPLLQSCILAQTYPLEQMEWVILDDSDDGEPLFRPQTSRGLKVVHERLPQRLPLGRKRNLSHSLCSGEIIVVLDDDDYYPRARVSHAVSRLLASDGLLAGCTQLPILLLPEQELWLAGPFPDRCVTAASFALRREALALHRYDDDASCGEEASFLACADTPIIELDPDQTILCIGHSTNTYDKRELIEGGFSGTMRRLDRRLPAPELLTPYLRLHRASAEVAAAVPAARPRIHLLNPLWDPCGGSERRTLELARMLAPRADVSVWPIGERPAGALEGWEPPPGVTLERQAGPQGPLPRGGTLVLVGFYFDLPDWIRECRPERLILVVNTDPSYPDFEHMLASLERIDCPLELHHASQWIAAAAGLAGLVMTSPIDLQRFQPAAGGTLRDPGAPFHVGRLSRDVEIKHHPGDLALYRLLARHHCRVSVMGGTVLAPQLEPDDQAIRLEPAGAQDSLAFLRSLDAFCYRTHPLWREPSGRVIHEAMAVGLPVVAHYSGGYAETIDHGQDGFLFDHPTEAAAILDDLRLDRALRQRIGRRARRTMERLHGPAARERQIQAYLGAPAARAPRLWLSRTDRSARA